MIIVINNIDHDGNNVNTYPKEKQKLSGFYFAFQRQRIFHFSDGAPKNILAQLGNWTLDVGVAGKCSKVLSATPILKMMVMMIMIMIMKVLANDKDDSNNV